MNAKRAKQIRQSELTSELGTTPSLIRKARRMFSRNLESQNPKPILSERQKRLKEKNRYKRNGFPNLNVVIMRAVSFLHKNKVYIGRYGMKTISFKPKVA